MIEKRLVNERGDTIRVSYVGNGYWFKIEKRISIADENTKTLKPFTQEVFFTLSEEEVKELRMLMEEDKSRQENYEKELV